MNKKADKSAPEPQAGGEEPAWDQDASGPQLAADPTIPFTPSQKRLVGAADAPPDSVGPLAPSIGEELDGTYRIDKYLGEGGMGLVVRARDLKLERDVAIKFIRPDLWMSDHIKKKFLKEARAMARLSHENVVAIYALGEVRRVQYLVMELIDGTSLDAMRIANAGAPMTVDETLRIVRQLCRAADAIHAADLVHRDIKPSNVLIGPAFRVALTDLGLVRAMDHSPEESSHGVAGTPAYMAPEVALGKEATASSDLYAIATIAYELLAGRPPFRARSAPEIMLKQVYDPPPRPSKFNSNVPGLIEEALLTALSKKKEERPASGMELFQSLSAAHGESTLPEARTRFLIADDDEDIRVLAQAIIEDAFPDSEVECVADGKSALDALERRPASLALIDLEMPGLTGVELTAALRKSDQARKTPIVVMTAVGGASDWKLLSALGANAFLVKPFDPIQLEVAVRRLLGLSTTTSTPPVG